MALDTLRCNHLALLGFRGLKRGIVTAERGDSDNRIGGWDGITQEVQWVGVCMMMTMMMMTMGITRGVCKFVCRHSRRSTSPSADRQWPHADHTVSVDWPQQAVIHSAYTLSARPRTTRQPRRRRHGPSAVICTPLEHNQSPISLWSGREFCGGRAGCRSD